MGYAAFGLYASDAAEKHFDLTPTEADKERLDRAIPKIRLVDKDN